MHCFLFPISDSMDIHVFDQQRSKKVDGDEFVSDGGDSEGDGSGAEEGASRGKKRRREAKGSGSSSGSDEEDDKPSKKTKQRRPPRLICMVHYYWSDYGLHLRHTLIYLAIKHK